MRLVMGGESLEGPLTGIGQYTYHLAKEILKHEDITDFKFLAHGRLREASSLLASGEIGTDEAAAGNPSNINQLLGMARSIAAQSKAAVGIYERLMPSLERYSLRNYGRDDVYHSPNYMLPNFPGRRVVSILDLSTFRFPEQHPEARVRFVNNHILRAIKHADHIIAISNLVKSEIIDRFNFPEQKITVTYLGAGELFCPMSRGQFEPTARRLNLTYKGYFLFVSSIEPRKNLERLLDAYLTYRDTAKDSALPLIVAGIPGWKSEHIHLRLRKMQKEGVLRYLGYIAQEELPSVMAGARSLLYPSLYEGFGLPVLEAMQCGTAVMTSKYTAMAEFGDTSTILVDSTDIDEMAGAMEVLATDCNAVASLESAGIAQAQQLSWAHCAKQTLTTYQQGSC